MRGTTGVFSANSTHCVPQKPVIQAAVCAKSRLNKPRNYPQPVDKYSVAQLLYTDLCNQKKAASGHWLLKPVGKKPQVGQTSVALHAPLLFA